MELDVDSEKIALAYQNFKASQIKHLKFDFMCHSSQQEFLLYIFPENELQLINDPETFQKYKE